MLDGTVGLGPTSGKFNKNATRQKKRKSAKQNASLKKNTSVDVSLIVPVSSLLEDEVEIEIDAPDGEMIDSLYESMGWEVEIGDPNNELDGEKIREKLFASIVETTAPMEEDTEQLTNKQKRIQGRPTMCQMKTIAVRPDVVESWDATSREPGLLIALKSWYNVVPIPGHWNSKRRYLAGKRALDRGPFTLPEHIQQTKITEIRSALVAREQEQTLRQKLRARARPKGQRMDLDYQTLHDAFFKYAKKPFLTGFGELYYEGKEQEMKFSKFKPGVLTDRLKDALGLVMPLAPPPWLYNMQRYGPPPAYPGHRVPGVNCPIPTGAEYGFGMMRWGAPPTDSLGAPAWGDLGPAPENVAWDAGEWTQFLWGEMEEAQEMEIEDMESDEEVLDTATTVAPSMDNRSEVSGVTATASIGLTSGLETPSSIDLRKGIESAQGGSLGLKPYKLLAPQAVDMSKQRGQVFASSTLYDVRESLKAAEERADIIAKKEKPKPQPSKSAIPKGFKF